MSAAEAAVAVAPSAVPRATSREEEAARVPSFAPIGTSRGEGAVSVAVVDAAVAVVSSAVGGADAEK